MKDLTSSFMLNNGLSIPCVGYGTFQTPNDETCAAVLEAIKVGYRHIDTAAFYGNEEGVGEAVRKSGVPREQLFITSKVWNSDRGYEKTKAAFAKTMKNLQMEYLDLLLIHWPANRKQFGDAAKGINAETWRAMEELYQEGKIKAIGLSNFLPHHIDELMETAQIKPMVNQIEFHPGWAQTDIVEYCLKNDIVVEAWSPRPQGCAGKRDAEIHCGEIWELVAQLCIRWVLQHGVLPLPKSVTPSRILENTKVFDFTIDAADMQAIDALKNIGGQCALPDEVDF